MKVLIVDDDPVTRHVLEAMVTKWGYDVEVASNGDYAWLRLAEETGPLVAVVDWMMPGISGAQLCQRISSRAGAEGFYTILFTSKASEEDHNMAGLAGANVHLVKSVDFKELKRHVDEGARVLESRMKQLSKS
jgi:DNA-binding response OmpR family regulator